MKFALKIKKPGEYKMIPVNHEAVALFRNYYNKPETHHRFEVYDNFLNALNIEIAKNGDLSPESFEVFTNIYIDNLFKKQKNFYM